MARSGFQRHLNRINPQLPARAYKTYSVSSPLTTHWKPATCEDAGCAPYMNGWQTFIDESSELGQRQAHYIRRQSGRHFTEERNEHNVTVFTFTAGQPCFKSQEHKVPVGRPEIYVVKDGDWRGSRGIIRRHVRADDWVDDFATHQDALAARRARG